MSTRIAPTLHCLRLLVWLLLPLLVCSCMSKSRALKTMWTIEPYSPLKKLSHRTKLADFDGQETDYHYVESKTQNAAETLVFIHGYPDSLFTWTKLIAPRGESAKVALSNSFNLLAMDLPGQAFTKQSRSGSRRKAMLEPSGAGRSLVTFLDAKATGSVVLVAHSFGALVALHAAKWGDQPPATNAHPRRWRLSGIVLISPEGTPRAGPEHLPTERELREGFLGWASAWHWGAGTFNWCFNPDSDPCHNRWTGAVEDGFKEMNTDPRNTVLMDKDLRTAHSLLMRLREHYRTNRYLVRRDKSCDWPILEWAGSEFQGKRVLIWGRKDNLFPVPIHSTFVKSLFRPNVGFELSPKAAHLVPHEDAELIYETLRKHFR